MKFKDIKVGVKILGSFLIIAVFLIIIGYVGLSGITRVHNASNQVKIYKDVSAEMLSREIAHLYWTQKALEEINDLSVTHLSVGGDDHACTTGKMLYGPVRKQLESDLPNLKELFKKIEQPHSKFHESADGIDQLLDETAESRQEAIKYFNETTAVQMAELITIFKEIRSEVENMSNAKLLEETEIESSAFFMGVLFIILGVILSVLLGIVISRSITKPLQLGVQLAQTIEKGDLTQELNLDRQDEIGVLSNALDNMTFNLRQIVSEMSESANTLSGSATEFSAISEQMFNSSENMNEKSATVSSATEEISTNMSTISAAAEQSSVNINVVASSAEEMSATVSEIAQNTSRAQQMANDAVMAVENALQKVNNLDKAAQDIGKVVEVILEIAEQTKLLALNATIEAARAGEAGKGFAIVAKEVKDLAALTNSSSEEIQQKITAIQSSTEGTISDINNIDKVIKEVNDVVTSIASSVEEQSAATKDISSNVTHAAIGLKDMAQNINHAASASNMIARDVVEVSRGSNEVKDSSKQVSNGVKELSRMSENLNNLVSTFKIHKN